MAVADGGERGMAAVVQALRMAVPFGATLTVLVTGSIRQGDDPQWRDRARATIDRARAWGREQGTPVGGMVLCGTAAAVILDAAREIGADLVVMPKDRRDGLLDFLAPSLSARIAASLNCPVLAVGG